jgi:transketolase C-terminal domain/subunit
LVYARWLKPFGTDALLASVQKTRRLVVVENGMRNGGLGASLVEHVTQSIPGTRCHLIASDDRFLAGGDWQAAMREAGIDDSTVLSSVEAMVR